MGLDWNWVIPLLAIGGRLPKPGVRNWEGIARIIDLRAEEQDNPAELSFFGIKLLNLPTPDLVPISQPMMWAGVHWIRAAWEHNERVLVHCEHGIGRSALLASCVLVSVGYTPCAALAKIKSARPQVSPSPEQLHALLDWTRAWRQKQFAPACSESWDDLARIAYSNIQVRSS